MPKGLTLLLAAASFAAAAPPTQRERDFAMSYMHATRKMFLDSVAGVSKAQWEFKPAPEVWSIAEVAEHIAISEDTIFEMITKKILAGPAAAGSDPSKDQKVIDALVDRSQKAKAPEMLRPANRWKSAEELIEHFKASRDRNIAYVQTSNDEWRAHIAPHPVLKAMDGYQWLLLLAGHSERHTLQLNEVKQMPGYPAK